MMQLVALLQQVAATTSSCRTESYRLYGCLLHHDSLCAGHFGGMCVSILCTQVQEEGEVAMVGPATSKSFMHWHAVHRSSVTQQPV